MNAVKRVFICACCVDLGLLLYWLVVGLDIVPYAYMFKDYQISIISDWNWSFLPLDLLVSATGLYAAWLYRQNNKGWCFFLVMSLTLMFCAGLQAIAFWAIRGDFDLSWWGMNLLLMLVPLGCARPLYRHYHLG